MEELSARVLYKKIIKQIWQKEWKEGIKGRHYFSVQPSLMHTSFTRLERRDSVVITRLRLGHCALNYGLARVGKHLDGRCLCGELETVKHVVMDCEILSAARNHMFETSKLPQIIQEEEDCTGVLPQTRPE